MPPAFTTTTTTTTTTTNSQITPQTQLLGTGHFVNVRKKGLYLPELGIGPQSLTTTNVLF